VSALAISLAVAALTWGVAPGSTVVATDPLLDPPALARAELPGDHVWLAPGWRLWPDLQLCTIVVHEVGHNAGRHHSADPLNVMYYRYVRPYWRCRRAFAP
jgi:hypothetical protein